MALNHPSTSLSTFFFLDKIVLSQKSGFLICVFVFLSLSCGVCGCVVTVWFSSFCCDIFLCVGDSNGKALSCVWMIRATKYIRSSRDIKSKSG